MKRLLRGASSAAMLLGLSAGLQIGWAQEVQAPQTPQGQTVTTSQPTPQTPAQTNAPAAQTTEQGEPSVGANRVVVTGSLLITAPEDAPKPVESYDFQSLRESGSPSVAEFVRDLSINYDSSLYGGTDSGVGGDNKANLRGLGDTATMVLLNGRRLTTDNGYGADLSTIPENALAAVDVLKDGASTTYGAGAVAGVINYRTRRDVDAPEIVFEKRMYDGSDGEYTFDFQTGWVGDRGNLLLTYSYEHSDALKQTERGFSSLPFNVNPEAYALAGGNPGTYTLFDNFYTARAVTTPVPPAPPGTTSTTTYTNPPLDFDTPGGINAHNDPRRLIQDYGSAAGCTAIGGQLVQTLQPGLLVSTASGRLNTNCAMPEYLFRDLVDEAEQHQGYAELNYDLSSDMSIQISALYSSSMTINRDIPSPTASNPATLGYNWSASATQAALNLANRDDTTCAGACGYVIPVGVQTFTRPTSTTTNNGGNPTGTFYRNPFIDDFITRTGQDPANYTNGGALYVGPGWRPFLFGGNGLTESGLHEGTDQTERIVLATELTGQLQFEGPLGFLNGINYKDSIQYNWQTRTGKDNRMLASRLQNALLGYGGPNCMAQDRVVTNYGEVDPVPNSTTLATQQARQNMRARYNNTIGVQSDTAPGTNGCMWFNPFASSFQTSIANGATNPNYGGAPYQNSRELIEWLFYERADETIRQALNMDVFFSGTVPESLFALPGGEIGWGGGTNWRQTEIRNSTGASEEGNDYELQACPFPDPLFISAGVTRKPIFINSAGSVTILEPDQAQGDLGCSSAGNGPGAFITGTPNLPSMADEQTFSVYGEVQLPVLDNLNGSLSWRRESFNDGRIEGDIWSAAAKYDITDDLFVRYSWSTNFRAVPELNETPGRIEVVDLYTGGRFANSPVLRLVEIDPELKPEDDTTINIGVGYTNNDLFGGRLRLGLDFWEILIEGEVVGGAGTAGLTSALEQTFFTTLGQPGNPTSATDFDQSFADCSSPVIVVWEFVGPCVQGQTRGSDVRVFKSITTNGAGFITNGVDYTASYTMPLFDGNLSIDARATQTMVYKDKGYSQFGAVIESASSILGYSGSSGRGREWRGNVTSRWANDTHLLSLRVNYDSNILDRGYAACLAGKEVAGAACGSSLETVFIDPVTGQALAGAARYSNYGYSPGDHVTADFTYIYTAPFWQDLELRASVINFTNEDPIAAQGDSGYQTGDPRGRVLELEVRKKF